MMSAAAAQASVIGANDRIRVGIIGPGGRGRYLMGEFKEEAMPDARSLGRMLVHLVNMHEAICTSSESHANVAKRLGDFALTTTRMANRNPQAATKLKRLSQVLDTASSRLGASTAADAGTIPT